MDGKNLRNFDLLAFGIFVVIFMLSTDVMAIPNPASVYCKAMNGTIEMNETPFGEQGLCVINGEKYDEWKFLEGKKGQNDSWCVKNGYGIETLCDGKSLFSSCRAVCIFQNGSKIDMGYLMHLYRIDPDRIDAQSQALSSGGLLLLSLAEPQQDYFDWRNINGTNFMTSVKNQDGGGTCWAYSVVGTIEAKYNIERNISNSPLHLDLSERNLASNNPDCGCNYCGDYDKGGLLVTPYDYIKNVGITTEQCFPDTYSNSYPFCNERCSNWSENLYKIADYDVFSTNNRSYIKKMLIENGPLTVGVYAYWQSDANGILQCTSEFQWFNHGMILVGYNDAEQYWIVKNSWGTGWGDGGYGYIKYGNCLVESDVQKFVYPKNISKGNFSPESLNCSNFVTVCKNGTCDSNTIQKAVEKVCGGGTIFVNDSTPFNEEIEVVKDNIILDCNNAVIDGNNTMGIGMWIIAKNTTIKNCIVKNFEYGMVLDTSSFDILVNNTLTLNTYGIYIYYSLGTNSLINNSIYSNKYGIYSNNNPKTNEIFNNEIFNNRVGIFSHQSNCITNSNIVCGNTQLDFNSTGWQSSSGDNNYCDKADGWNDNETTGCTYSCQNINNTQGNLIDPPLGENVCIGEETNITANITINTSNPSDPLLENVSVCINVTCAGGYVKNEKQYVNFSETLFANVTFNVTPTTIGACNVTTCVDCDDRILESNETDNCGNATFDVINCSQQHQGQQEPFPKGAPVPGLSDIGLLILIILALILGLRKINGVLVNKQG